jgi:undecaprenyl-diphosphatase
MDTYQGVELDIPYRPDVVRSPTDALNLVIALAVTAFGITLALVFPNILTSFGADLDDVFDQIPGPIEEFIVLFVILAGFGIPVLILGWFIVRKDTKRIVMVVVAGGVAAAGTWLAYGFVAKAADVVVATPASFGPLEVSTTPFYPYYAAITAALTVANPVMRGRWRKAAWGSLWVAVILRLTVGTNLPADLIIAIGIGWATGSAILLIVGGPNRAATPPQLVMGLRRASIDPARIAAMSVDARGSTPYLVDTIDGERLFVKALSTDERSADILFRVYRRLRLKNIGDEPAFSTLRRAVEHEALVAITAGLNGVRTPAVRAGAQLGDEQYSMILAFDALDGRPFDEVPDDEISDDLLRDLWGQIAILRSRRIAHRDLRLANVFLDDADDPWIIDFGFSELSASDTLIDTDVAELVASSALKVGAERAVRAAVAVIGKAGVCRAAPRMQPLALSKATRDAVEDADGLAADIVDQVKEACGLDTIDFDSVSRFHFWRRGGPNTVHDDRPSAAR